MCLKTTMIIQKLYFLFLYKQYKLYASYFTCFRKLRCKIETFSSIMANSWPKDYNGLS